MWNEKKYRKVLREMNKMFPDNLYYYSNCSVAGAFAKGEEKTLNYDWTLEHFYFMYRNGHLDSDMVINIMPKYINAINQLISRYQMEKNKNK